MNLGTKEQYISRFKNSLGNRTEQAAKDWEHLSKATMNKDISIIPNGIYCYNAISGPDKHGILNTKTCPYFKTKEYNGVWVPYCEYLEWGDVSNVTDEEYKKLLEYFGNEEKMKGKLPLGLLWDGCKECGENNDIPEEEEK